MRFNIAYMGPEWLFHLRRDFILVLKYALEDLGHDVALSGSSLESDRFNLIIGAYFLPSDQIHGIAASGIPFGHVNTEVIGRDMLNFNPEKVDFLGAYLPSMKRGRFVWDIIMDNMKEHERYGVNAHFLRWGSHARMADIAHRTHKDLDFYFFGMLSPRRTMLLQALVNAGLQGVADHSCPYFLRNDRISRARIQLNLIQDDKYSHVNAIRVCYLADNACCTLSEREHDPAGYLRYTVVVESGQLTDHVRYCLGDNRWKRRGEKAKAEFSELRMTDLMAELLEKSLAGTA